MNRALASMAPLYGAALRAKNLAWDRGWRRPTRLENPIVSIGNLSVGGSGKTPLTIWLAQLLTQRGFAVDVLSRGYGRQSKAVERVIPGGPAEQFGDEPLLIAQTAGVPVFVGASRYRAGLLAEQSPARPGLHLLDDGFQHRQLSRDVDIVVLHRDDFYDHLLPTGRLRETFSSLSRAQIVVMRQEDRELEPELRRRGFGGPIWWMERKLEVVQASRVVAFCAIARPEEFFSGLRSAGISIAAIRAWRDHHLYQQLDIAELTELQRQHAAEAFMTTEKDMVRLTSDQRKTLENAATVHSAKLLVRLHGEDALLKQLCAFLPADWGDREGKMQSAR